MKKFLTIIVVAFLFVITAKNTKAKLLTVNNEGEVVWNVLSLQDEVWVDNEIEDFSVRQVTQVNSVGNELINISQKDGEVKLSVGSGESTKEINLDNTNQELIEIEERQATQKLLIGKRDGHFTIQQSGITVNTLLPIQINPKTAKLSLTTSSGENYLYVLPRDAIRSILRTKVITDTKGDLELTEVNDSLVYKIPGEKVIPLLNLYNYSFAFDSYVSAQTGELVSVDAPTWYKIFGFLITQQT